VIVAAVWKDGSPSGMMYAEISVALPIPVRGIAYSDKKRLCRAIEDFNRAITLSPAPL